MAKETLEEEKPIIFEKFAKTETKIREHTAKRRRIDHLHNIKTTINNWIGTGICKICKIKPKPLSAPPFA